MILTNTTKEQAMTIQGTKTWSWTGLKDTEDFGTTTPSLCSVLVLNEEEGRGLPENALHN